jgi:hypothetical protein
MTSILFQRANKTGRLTRTLMTGKDPVRANHIRPVKIYTPYTFRDPEHATGWFSSSSFIIRALRSGIKRKGAHTQKSSWEMLLTSLKSRIITWRMAEERADRNQRIRWLPSLYRLRIDSLSRETIRIKIKRSSFNYRKVPSPAVGDHTAQST